MFDIDNELKSLGRKKHHPDGTLFQRTLDKLRIQAQSASRRRSSALRWAAVPMAAAVLAAAIMFAVLPGTSQTSYFTIDINPSIGIETDSSGVILSVKAQNVDAQDLLTGMDLTGMSFIDALRRIVQAAEEQGYLKDNGHVLVAHFGVTAQVSEDEVENAVLESTHRQVNVLLLQSEKSDYQDPDPTHQSAGVSLLRRNAQRMGIEETDINAIIEAIKKNNNADNAVQNGKETSSASAAESALPSSSHGNSGTNSNNGNSDSNGNHDSDNVDEDNGNNASNGNNGNNGGSGNNVNNGNSGSNDNSGAGNDASDDDDSNANEDNENNEQDENEAGPVSEDHGS